MTTKKKIIIGTVLLTFVILIVLVFWSGKLHSISCRMCVTNIIIDQLLQNYIIANNGNFPPSETDLEQKGFIKKITTTYGIEYFLWDFAAYEQAWYPCRYPDFALFTIAYGIEPENIKMIDGKLYDKSTNNQLLLIDGPYKKSYQGTYEQISVKLYELMLKEKQKAKAQEKPQSNIE